MFVRTAVLVCALASVAGSQAPTPSPDTVSIADRNLFHHSDLLVAAGFAAGTVAMFPLDRHMAAVIHTDKLLQNETLRHAATTFRFFGGSGPIIIGTSMYVVGRLGHIPKAAELAVHASEALLVGEGFTVVLKTALGRARPYLSSDTNPRNFAFMRGRRGTDYQSFPSGHSTTAFSVAAAVSAETREWWPRTTWIFGPILYGGASLVGLSRIYDDRHWASDVVMGAAIGTFAGLKTVRFNHTHSGNRLDRLLLGESAQGAHIQLMMPAPHTVGLLATIAW